MLKRPQLSSLFATIALSSGVAEEYLLRDVRGAPVFFSDVRKRGCHGSIARKTFYVIVIVVISHDNALRKPLAPLECTGSTPVPGIDNTGHLPGLPSFLKVSDEIPRP